MYTLRRRLASISHTALSRQSLRHVLALLLIVIVPGGLVVPICYGLYGALRHTLSGKAGIRMDAALPAAAITKAGER